MKNKLTARELSSFCGQMGMLLHSGISTAEGLHILCDESKTDADPVSYTHLDVYKRQIFSTFFTKIRC